MTIPQPPPRSDNSAGRRTVLGVCFLLVMVVFFIFGRTHGYGFVGFDDGDYFSSNYHVRGGLTWKGVLWAFQTGYASNWHPLTWLSLMLDVELFGTGPAGPHLTNVILHAINTMLLFLLLKRLTSTLWPSAFVAALFAIHPLHVESVAWVSERKDVLSGLFFMLTLWAYARYVQGVTSGAWPAFAALRRGKQVTGIQKNIPMSDPSRVTRHASLFYGLALLFFALGLMSKPMLVTLPFVLLLLDYWPLGRVTSDKWRVTRFRIPVPQLSSLNHLLLGKLPFLLLSAASCVATILAQREVIKSMIVLPLTLRLGNALVSCVTYIAQTVWPDNLAVFYPYRFDIPTWQTAGAGALLLFITLLVFRTARRFPYFTTGWLWYLGMLVPVIGLVQVGGQSHADRYTYLPQIGLFLVIVWAIRAWTASWRWRRQVLGVTAFSVIAVLMAGAWKQTAYWRNDQSLWTHALACTSGNYTAHNDLGYVLAAQGRTNEAIEHYQKALEIYPDYAEADNNLGTVFLNQGRLDEAAEYYHRALEANPSFAEAHNNLGILLAKQGRITEAIEHYQKAIELNPNRAEMYNNLGNLLAIRGRPAEAIGQFQKALEMEPDNAKAHYNLANIFIVQGRWDEAIEHYQRALKQMPDSIHAHYQLGLALQYRGKFAAAIAQFQKVLELDPRHVTAQNNLAWLLATCPDNSLRNGQKAVELAQQAVQLSGGNAPEILDTLAAAYAEAGRFPEAIETAQRVLDLSAAQNNKPLAKVIQNQLKLYEAGSPFRDTSQTSSPTHPSQP
ncbi:MAG: tetratricopeptide repeat protein [Verrucomicrobiota bacterium]